MTGSDHAEERERSRGYGSGVERARRLGDEELRDALRRAEFLVEQNEGAGKPLALAYNDGMAQALRSELERRGREVIR